MWHEFEDLHLFQECSMLLFEITISPHAWTFLQMETNYPEWDYDALCENDDCEDVWECNCSWIFGWPNCRDNINLCVDHKVVVCLYKKPWNCAKISQFLDPSLDALVKEPFKYQAQHYQHEEVLWCSIVENKEARFVACSQELFIERLIIFNNNSEENHV